jgi:hypothetical protein
VKVATADEAIIGFWDLFIALHCDGSTSSTASGASVGYRYRAGGEAADIWKDRFRVRGWPYGFRDDNYTSALRYYYGTGWAASAGIPAAFILEHGFLTNPTRDRAWLRSETGRRAAALALADTIAVIAGDQPLEDDMALTDGEINKIATRAKEEILDALAEDGPRGARARQKIAGEVLFGTWQRLYTPGMPDRPVETLNLWNLASRAVQGSPGGGGVLPDVPEAE